MMFNLPDIPRDPASSPPTHDPAAHFFDSKTAILDPRLRCKVVFGEMNQESRSLSQVLWPYLQATGGVLAGLYGYAKAGAEWLYGAVTNTVYPYAAEQLPKLLFVVKERLTEADQRERLADQRERSGDQRERSGDQREGALHQMEVSEEDY